MFLFGLLYPQHSLGNLTFLSLDDIENKASIFPAKTKKEFATIHSPVSIHMCIVYTTIYSCSLCMMCLHFRPLQFSMEFSEYHRLANPT